VTGRPASTYANDWGGEIKVEIPETGVSIGELNRYLRQWLGSQTSISGEVVRTAQGLAVTARTGASAGRTFAGPEADLDKLIEQAAQSVYQRTQPYRWAVYLASNDRPDEALAQYAWLAEHGSKEDRAWAYVGWATLLQQRNDIRRSLAKSTRALELDPRIDPAWLVQGLSFSALGRLEDVLAAGRAHLSLLERGGAKGVTPENAKLQQIYLRGFLIPALVGDSARAAQTLSRLPDTFAVEGSGAGYSSRNDLVGQLIALHDLSGARRIAVGGPPVPGLDIQIALELEDWTSALTLINSAPAAYISVRRVRALILARLGRLAEAEAMIASTPLDCTQCLIDRGDIRSLAGDRRGADRWFAEAARRMDAMPFGYAAWAASLLGAGDADGAIAKLRLANRRGPHFSDALELWGEALLKKGDYAGAAAKFAAADKHAPRWGRNHLRWGEALLRAGRYREARAQFEAANGLDLSRPDRAALTVFLDRTARGPLRG
jgi:tetratricopeptide (TPR) repeat protein